MIFKLAKSIIFGIIKKIILLIVVIGIAAWFIFFKDSDVKVPDVSNVNVGELTEFAEGLIDRNIEFELKQENALTHSFVITNYLVQYYILKCGISAGLQLKMLNVEQRNHES